MEQAQDHVTHALEIAHELGQAQSEGTCLRVQGQVWAALGKQTAALDAFAKSLELLTTDPYEAARTKLAWAQALPAEDGVNQRVALLEEAKASFARLGAKRDLASAHTALLSKSE